MIVGPLFGAAILASGLVRPKACRRDTPQEERTRADLERIAAAQAKRERKATKRLATRPVGDGDAKREG